MSVKKELGEKIERIRKKRKLTQEQLAEMIDISPSNLSGIELGTNFVKADTLEKILHALNVTTEEIFSNEHLRDNKILIKEIKDYLRIIEQDREKLEYSYKILKFIANK